MKKLLAGFVAGVLATFVVASGAFAQSSGSFTASVNTGACAITASDGSLTGGINTTSLPPVTVKVSSGSGTALVITPSLVTGLFTDNKITANSSTSTQNVGLQVTVAVDGSTANVVPEEDGAHGVIYDQRWIQVSSSVISALDGCTSLPAGSACFQLVESTLSAHSFNFYVSNLSSGVHTITTSWSLVGGNNGEATCVGPGTLTVTQVKNFSFNSPLGF